MSDSPHLNSNPDTTVHADPGAEWPKVVAHADMDAFYAAVEQLDNPELRGQPVVEPINTGRGVVLTASYEARPFKVGSAMPMAQALRRCPKALVVPPRFERYTEVSAAIMKVFADFSPRVEAISLDEAFLDMSGAAHIFGPPHEMGQKIKQAVRDATGLTISVGVASTKYVAKVASAHDKPNGLTVVAPAHAVDWLSHLPVSCLWGAGPKNQERLNKLGYSLIGDVASADPRVLREQLGHAGAHFYELAHARDPRGVEGARRNRSMGSDRTLMHDLSDPVEIAVHLRRSADRIARRLRSKDYLAGGVRVRLKTTNFQLLSRQCTLAAPTDTAEDLHAAAITLLARFTHKGPFRLVGMAAHSLLRRDEPQQLDLLEQHDKQRTLEGVLDQIDERFGDAGMCRARDVSALTLAKSSPTLDFVRDVGAVGEDPDTAHDGFEIDRSGAYDSC